MGPNIGYPAMIMYALIVLVVLLTLIVLLVVKNREKGSSSNSGIPGLNPSCPKEGNLGDLEKAGSIHEFLTSLHERFGPVASFWWGTTMVASIYKPENFKEYATIFDRPEVLFQSVVPLLGRSSTQYANGEDGRRRHTTYSRFFTEGNMDNFYGVWNRVTRECMGKLADVPRGQHVIIRENGFHFAIKSILLSVFGAYFEDDEKVRDIRECYDAVVANMARTLGRDDPDADSNRDDKLGEAVRGIIQWRMDNPPRDETERLFVDVLMTLHGQDEDSVIDDARLMLVASFHTTGLMITWCLYFLAKHPDVQQKVLDEVIEVTTSDGDVRPEQFDRYTYTRQVLNEVLRCSVLAPYAARVADRDMELKTVDATYTVPQGTPVFLALGLSMQDPERWPKPLEFDPERFNPDTHKIAPFGFEPFGFAGKRKCPGYRVALHGGVIYLAHALRLFQFGLVPGQVVERRYGFVTTSKEEIWLTVEPRST